MTDERLPVLWEKGVETFGDEEMMQTMVQNFEPLTFDPVMRDLSKEVGEENWVEVKRHAHTLKGSSSYIGAYRFSEVCLLLQNAALDPGNHEPNFEEVYSTYDKVLKEGKILQNYLSKLQKRKPDSTIIDGYISDFERMRKNIPASKLLENFRKKKGGGNDEKNDVKENKIKTDVTDKKEEKNADASKKEENKNLVEAKKDIIPVIEGKEVLADQACCKQCTIF